ARLKPQRSLQSLRRLKNLPTPGKLRIKRWVVCQLLARATKDNRDICEILLMRLHHEFERGWPERDDQIWPAALIFPDVCLTKPLLISRIVKQSRLQILGI